MPTMVGDQVGIATAMILGAGSAEVTAEIDTPAYVAAISNPNPCSLDINGETSCEFAIESIWDSVNLNNSVNDAIVTEVNLIYLLTINKL